MIGETFDLILSGINMVTGPIIEAQRADAANGALLVVFPSGGEFEDVDLSTVSLPSIVTAAWKEKSGNGYVFRMNATGYQAGLVIMCGVDAEGKITGSQYIESKETYGAENELNNAYNGQTLESFNEIKVSGATKTSTGYKAAIEAALQSFVIMSGGSVDLRTPEQILAENCNAALGTEGLSFTKWFAVEVLDGVDAIYTAEGNDSTVVLVGETYVGLDSDGKAVTAGIDADTAAKAEAAIAIYKASELTQITLPDGAGANVKGAWQTASGNYVIEVQAAGYGIHGDGYTASGYITIKVALTEDGKIISTYTVSQNESKGYGDECANPNFYEQFNGSTVENFENVPNISGATITSTGYKTGIQLAFTTLDLIKGGVQ